MKTSSPCTVYRQPNYILIKTSTSIHSADELSSWKPFKTNLWLCLIKHYNLNGIWGVHIGASPCTCNLVSTWSWVRAITIHEDRTHKEIIKSCTRITELINSSQVLYETKYQKKKSNGRNCEKMRRGRRRKIVSRNTSLHRII